MDKILIVFLLTCFFSCQKQTDQQDLLFDIKLKKNNNSVYIPKDLDDAVSVLHKAMNVKLIKIVQKSFDEQTKMERDLVGPFELRVAFAIRGYWDLWNQNRLTKWFNEKGLFHADDISLVIAKALVAKLQEDPFDLELEIKQHKNFWEKKKTEDFLDKPVPNIEESK